MAYIRSLAQMRGRNVEWAEKAVREAASLSAEEAYDAGVIELVAKDLATVLREAAGHEVDVLGTPHRLATEGLVTEVIKPDWRTRLLAVITDPQIAYFLMLLGFYGLIFEFSNPGYVLPGVVGGICLLLALYAFQALPVNYAGIALIGLGIAFMIGELFVSSFGVLAFILGSVILFDVEGSSYEVSRSFLTVIGLVSAAGMAAAIELARRAHRSPVKSGAEEMIGMLAVARAAFEQEGHVRAHGEWWLARSEQPVRVGQELKINDIDGLILVVEPVE